jgi:hypothetical protein
MMAGHFARFLCGRFPAIVFYGLIRAAKAGSARDVAEAMFKDVESELDRS